MWAQNPTLNTFTVELKTEQGKDTTIQIHSINTNTFRFIGGEGMFYNPITGQNTHAGNQNLHGWIGEVDYNAAQIMALPSEDMAEFLESGLRFCISQKQGLAPSDSIIWGQSDNYRFNWKSINHLQDYVGYSIDIGTFDMQACQDENLCYTLAMPLDNKNPFFAELHNLKYMTTYYVRPYINLNGNLMYGEELSFTTPRTIEGALYNEQELTQGNYYDKDSKVVLNTNALCQLLPKETEITPVLKKGVIFDFGNFIANAPTIMERLKPMAYRTIDCTDGTLHVINDVPADIVSDFQNFFYGDIAFSPIGHINNEDKNGSSFLTRYVGDIQTVENCDASWNVPYNSYVDFPPANSSVNPSIAINIPKYLLPQTYDLYVVMVIPDMENDLRPYRFYTWMYEQTEDETNYRITTLINPTDGSKVFVSDSVRCDTVYLGNYTFSGTPQTIIQFTSNIRVRDRNIYNREMRIAQIRLVPIKEEE